MYKIFLGILIAAVLIINAYAQPAVIQKQVVCDQTKTVMETLTGKEYKEQPFWIGTDETSRFVMLTNEKTGAWTFVQFNENIACILGTGEHYKQIFSKPAV